MTMNQFEKQGNEEFWEEQGRKFKENLGAVNFDPREDELEKLLLSEFVNNPGCFCDFGCGNGRTTIELAKQHPASEFHGWDFSQSMVDAANSLKEREGVANVFFKVVDGKSGMPSNYIDAFDMVMTKRMLINLKGDQKNKALKNIAQILKKGGVYLMVECFLEPLNRTNEFRKFLGLDEIKVHSFNEYINLGMLEEVEIDFDLVKHIDFESEYYYMSRIYNAALSNGSPSYDAPINMLSTKLNSISRNVITGFAPEQLYVFLKK